MGEVTIVGLIEGGKATGGQPLGPQLGPLGVNINGIVASINEKTKEYSGVKIKVKVIVNTDTKDFKVEVGSPSMSAMILKEINAQLGAKTKDETVGNITIDQLKNLVKTKEASMQGKTNADRAKQVLGTCKSMGVTCEGKNPKEVIKKINAGEIKL